MQGAGLKHIVSLSCNIPWRAAERMCVEEGKSTPSSLLLCWGRFPLAQLRLACAHLAARSQRRLFPFVLSRESFVTKVQRVDLGPGDSRLPSFGSGFAHRLGFIPIVVGVDFLATAAAEVVFVA